MPGERYTREEFRRWCEAQPRGRFERVDGCMLDPPGMVITVEELFGR